MGPKCKKRKVKEIANQDIVNQRKRLFVKSWGKSFLRDIGI